MFPNSDSIQAKTVWAPGLRLSHWLLALGTLFLLTSAWLMNYALVDQQFWYDWHIIAGQALLFVLLYRFFLLFRPGSGHWKRLFQLDMPAIIDMLKFYLSLARFPLRGWHSHNPFWRPIYIAMLLLLALGVTSGLLLGTPITFFGVETDTLHRVSASVLGILCIAHIIAAGLHDWKGKGAHISAMFNGLRYFHLDQPTGHVPSQKVSSQKVSIQDPRHTDTK